MKQKVVQKKNKSELWIAGFYRKDNTWEIFWDGELYEGTGPQEFKFKLYDLFDTEDNQEYSVFLNDFEYIGELFPGKFDSVFVTYDGVKTHSKRVFNKKNNKIVLKNFERFIPKQSVKIFKGKEHPAFSMIEYLSNPIFGISPYQMKNSLGYVLKKYIFYRGIEEELRQDIWDTGRNMWTENMYNNLLCGNKSGLLRTKFDSVEEYNFVDEWDLSNAYTSVFINDYMFPIGRTYELHGSFAVKALRNCLKNYLWFKIYVPKEVKVTKAVEYYCQDTKTQDYGIEYWDYRSLTELLNVDPKYFEELLMEDGVVFYESQSGRVHDKVRGRLMEFRELRMEAKRNNDTFKDMIYKQLLEVIYGKALQKYTFEDHNRELGHFSEGINYIQPHMSMHCCAAIRYRLLKAQVESEGEVVYYDTDSIHGYDLKEYVEKDNLNVMAANLVAGYESNIGCWKLEHSECCELFLGPKQRIVLDNNEWTVKVSGITPEFVMNYIDEMKEKGLDNRQILNEFYLNKVDNVPVIAYNFNRKTGWTEHHMTFKEFTAMNLKHPLLVEEVSHGD